MFYVTTQGDHSLSIMSQIASHLIQKQHIASFLVRKFATFKLMAVLSVALNCFNWPAFADSQSPEMTYLVGVPVVELFTSQGCPNCPAADRTLARLHAEGDVLALSVHVDYWNYNGWVDRYSSAENSQRQLQYKDAMGLPYVYTPQFVINGKLTFENQASSGMEMAVKMLGAETTGVSANTLSPGEGQGIQLFSDPLDVDLTLQFVFFDSPMMTVPSAGRNKGKTIINVHPVTAWHPIQTWDGSSRIVPWPETGSYGVALLVTNPITREILMTVTRIATAH